MHRVTSELGVVIARFRADCGSFSKEIVRIVDKRAESLHLAFVSVPAKWVRTGRQNVLNLYTNKAYYAEIFLE